MAQLLEKALELPHSLKPSLNGLGKVESFVELHPDHRWKMVAKVVPLGDDRTEVTVRRVNMQKVVDLAQIPRRRGPRIQTDERDMENIARAGQRARKAVRHLCQLMKVDRMLTFGTRCTIPLSELLADFQRFARSYGIATGKKLEYVAVPEPHADGDHWHIHVAMRGWFDITTGLRIWHALRAKDDADHLVNGSINIKTFRVRNGTEDFVSIIAGYISKYVGKSLATAFNSKSYWATRVKRDEHQYHLLESQTPEAALNEVCVKLGVPLQCILLTHEGCFFPLLEQSGFWLKVTPEMPRTFPF